MGRNIKEIGQAGDGFATPADDIGEEIRKLRESDVEDHGNLAGLVPDADNSDPRYLPLLQVLADAYGQAANGKGHDRHSAGKPFIEQPIIEITRMQGESIDGHTYQGMKKLQEAGRMVSRKQYQAAVAELYGVINYAAAAIIRVQEIETENGAIDRRV